MDGSGTISGMLENHAMLRTFQTIFASLRTRVTDSDGVTARERSGFFFPLLPFVQHNRDYAQ